MQGGENAMADQLILKESMFHDDSVKSIHVREDFLSDGAATYQSIGHGKEQPM